MEDRALLVRRPLPWILLLAAILHGVGISRSPLPAQDGLKYIRIAKSFQTDPWVDVVRSSDQHPLYPFLISWVQPLVGMGTGGGAESWRLAAQVVSLMATLCLLVAIYGWAQHFTSQRTAVWSCLIWLALPIPARVGHDTLSDCLALSAMLFALNHGVRWLRTGSRREALISGFFAGFGYLARPEVALVPVVLLVTGVGMPLRVSRGGELQGSEGTESLVRWRWMKLVIGWRARPGWSVKMLAGTWLVFLVMVGSYALVKGEVSEKLSVRLRGATEEGLRSEESRPSAHPLPDFLGGGDWDFSPKEEWGAPGKLSSLEATRRLGQAVGEGVGWLGGGLAVAGLVWGRCRQVGRTAAVVGLVYGGMYVVVLVRHAMVAGYLSERHVLPLVLLTLPRGAMGLREVLSRVGSWRGWSWSQRRMMRLLTVAVLVGVGLAVQLRPGHPSRWGHLAAGQWLVSHAEPGEAVLDTRGWAAFVSGLPSYDYWHVRQALSDSRLSYLVVTRDELEADSRRAETLRALIERACQLAVAYPERAGGRDASVRIYRFNLLDTGHGGRP